MKKGWTNEGWTSQRRGSLPTAFAIHVNHSRFFAFLCSPLCVCYRNSQFVLFYSLKRSLMSIHQTNNHYEYHIQLLIKGNKRDSLRIRRFTGLWSHISMNKICVTVSSIHMPVPITHLSHVCYNGTCTSSAWSLETIFFLPVLMFFLSSEMLWLT